VRAFTNPILHGDIIFVVRTHYQLLTAVSVPHENPNDPGSAVINGGFPFTYHIGWDIDLDGAIDNEFPEATFIDIVAGQIYPGADQWRHEIAFGELDSATYVGRIHFNQDITYLLMADPFPMGQLVIEFVGVPANRKVDANLPNTISASATVQIDEFNYDLPG